MQYYSFRSTGRLGKIINTESALIVVSCKNNYPLVTLIFDDEDTRNEGFNPSWDALDEVVTSLCRIISSLGIKVGVVDTTDTVTLRVESVEGNEQK